MAHLANYATGDFVRALRLIRLAEDRSFDLTCSADSQFRVALKFFDLGSLVALYVLARPGHNGSPYHYTIFRFSADGLIQEIECPQGIASLISISEEPNEAIKHELAQLAIA